VKSSFICVTHIIAVIASYVFKLFGVFLKLFGSGQVGRWMDGYDMALLSNLKSV